MLKFNGKKLRNRP